MVKNKKAVLFAAIGAAVCAVAAGMWLVGQQQANSGSISVIGGADGPTAIFVADRDTLDQEEKKTLRLQEALHNLINQMEGVAGSTVIIEPATEGREKLVSVSISMSSGGQLTLQQETAIKELILNSVNDLSEDRIFFS